MASKICVQDVAAGLLATAGWQPALRRDCRERARVLLSRMKLASRLVACWVLGWLLFAIAPDGLAQTYQGKELVRAELLADTNAIVPGKPFTVGLLLKMAPGWHTYWKFSGDAGLPTELKWKLPPGWKTGEIQWPIPLKTIDPGDIETYGYENEVLLMQEITPPPNIDTSSVKLIAEANWLVCEKICIPGSATLQVDLPVASTSQPANTEVFARYRRLLPLNWPEANVASAEWNRVGSDIRLKITSRILARYPAVDFFPLPGQETIVGHPAIQSRNNNEILFRIPLESAPKSLSSMPGLMVFSQQPNGDDRAAWQITTDTDCVANSHSSRAGNFHVSAIRFSRRHYFEFDAVRAAGDLTQNFRIHPASRPKPSENFAKRTRVHDWNFCVVYRAGAAAHWA